MKTDSPAGKKVKNQLPYRRLPQNGKDEVRRSMLAMHAAALSSPSAADNTARIVQVLADHHGLVFPRWRDLSSIDQFRLRQLAGKQAGLNWTFTFNISDEQREQWIEKHGNIAEGFRREVIKGLRHIFPDGPDYWFVVEPKRAKGAKAKHYRDRAGALRRFDIHGAIYANKEQLGRVQQSIWARAFKIKPADMSDTHPLQKLGRSAYMTPIRDDGWMSYCLKAINRTISDHSDICGDKPFGASQRLQQDAQEKFETYRQFVADISPMPAEVEAAIRSVINAVEEEVPVTRVIDRLTKIESNVRMTILKHFPGDGPDIAADVGAPASTEITKAFSDAQTPPKRASAS